MSLDRSLRSASSLSRHRNVLTRAERLDKLKEEEKWNEDKSVFGLPKVAHRKVAVGKVKAEPGAEGAVPGAAPVAGAAGAPAAGAKAAGAKGAAPAAGAKAAAPAAGAKAAAPAAGAKKK